MTFVTSLDRRRVSWWPSHRVRSDSNCVRCWMAASERHRQRLQ